MLPLASVSNFKKAKRASSISASVNRTFSAPEASKAIMKKFNGTSEIRPAVKKKKYCLLLFRFFARLIARVLLTGTLFTFYCCTFFPLAPPTGHVAKISPGLKGQTPNEPTNNYLCGKSCCFTKRPDCLHVPKTPQPTMCSPPGDPKGAILHLFFILKILPGGTGGNIQSKTDPKWTCPFLKLSMSIFKAVR